MNWIEWSYDEPEATQHNQLDRRSRSIIGENDANLSGYCECYPLELHFLRNRIVFNGFKSFASEENTYYCQYHTYYKLTDLFCY